VFGDGGHVTVADHVTAELQARGMPGFWSKLHALDCVLSAQVSLAPVRALGSVFFFRATPHHVCVSVCLSVRERISRTARPIHWSLDGHRGGLLLPRHTGPRLCVCLSVCLSVRPSVRERISRTARPVFTGASTAIEAVFFFRGTALDPAERAVYLSYRRRADEGSTRD